MNEMTILKPEKSEASIDVVLWNGRAIEALRIANSISITDDIEEGMAADSLTATVRFQKEVEEDRKSQVSPFNELVTKINATYKTISKPIDEAIVIIKRKRGDYLLEKDKKIAEENKRRQLEYQRQIEETQRLTREANERQQLEYQKLKEEAERIARVSNKPVNIAPPPEIMDAPIIAPPAVILETKEAIHTETGTASARKEWCYEVIDIAKLYKANPSLVKLEPKAREIKEAIKNGEQIDGLRVYQDYAQSTRTR